MEEESLEGMAFHSGKIALGSLDARWPVCLEQSDQAFLGAEFGKRVEVKFM